MKLDPGAVAVCLNGGSEALVEIIDYLKKAEVKEIDVITGLSSVQASIFTLAMLFDAADEHKPDPEQLEGLRLNPPSEPVPSYIQGVTDDNPNLEDKDQKKAREEDNNFYGR